MNEAKKKLVLSWLKKAQEDLASARVLAAADPPILGTAIYHCQQAAEKAVKGFLAFCDHEFEKIHDIEVLVKTAIPYEAGFSAQVEAARKLTPYAAIFRYPGDLDEPTKEHLELAVSYAQGIYVFVLSALPVEMRP